MTLAYASAPATAAMFDREAVDRVRRGNGASFELLMRRHNRRLYRIARGILRNEAEAEDAVQEAYVRAYEKLKNFRGAGLSPPGWQRSPSTRRWDNCGDKLPQEAAFPWTTRNEEMR